MNIFEKNQKLDEDYEDGIWLDYKDHHWFFFIKDKMWDKEEISHVSHSDVTVSFIQKGIVDAFLLEIYDCLETSDIPFCIKEADVELFDSLDDHQDYSYVVILLDESNTIVALQEYPFLHENSNIIKSKLKERVATDYEVRGFEKGYEKLLKQYEPYELEQFALFTQVK